MRAEDVHPNPSIFEFEQPCAGERSHGGFAGAVTPNARNPLMLAMDPLRRMDRCHRTEQRPPDVEVEGLVEVSSVSLLSVANALVRRWRRAHRTCLFPLDCFVQTIEVRQIGCIALHAGHVAADELHDLVKFVLPSGR